MESIHIWIQYNGVWSSDFRYKDYKMDGIVVPQECSYTTLVCAVKKMLVGVGLNGLVNIEYVLKDGLRPMEVYNDMSLKFYIDLRRTTGDVTKYPLCVTLKEQQNNIVCANVTSAAPLQESRQNMLQISDMYMAPDDDLVVEYDGDDNGGMSLDNICIITDPLHDDVSAGQLYKDKETLMSVMRNLALKEDFQFKVYRSSPGRYTLLCAGKECDWSMQSSSVGNSKVFKIRKFNNTHSCPEEERLLSQRNASYAAIGEIIKEKFKDPKTVYTPANIIQDIQNDYGLELNYMKAWRSKERALELLRGNPSKSYGILPSYLFMLKQTNPGSVTKLHKTPDNRFMYVYISLYASIRSWEYCRPIVVVDGCFISSVHGGTLIAASTQDGEGSIVPLAYAVVDSENDKSWEWFFQTFRETYGVRAGMCIVSDRCPSITRACAITYPEVPHCICIYHLWNNVKVKFKVCHKQIGDIFFTLANAYTFEEFDYYMDEVEKIDKRVKKYLFDIGYHKWSRAHAQANRYEVMTSNITESINGRNKHARSLPIIELLESMRDMVRKWSCENRKAAMGTFKVLTNNCQSTYKANMKAGSRMLVKPSTDYIYEVHEGVKKHSVCLANKTCSCRRFQMDGMPCKHAHAALKYGNMDGYAFCSSYCTKENLIKTYDEPVYPMQDQSSWNIPEEILAEVVLPPKSRLPPGRPKKRRIKAGWEINQVKCKLCCSRCGAEGHNCKTCRNRPILD